MQEIDPFDLDFYEYSRICDDPKLLEKLENTYYDSEFDDWVDAFDKEQAELQKNSQSPELPDNETIQWSEKPKKPSLKDLPTEKYEMGVNFEQIDDWVKE